MPDLTRTAVAIGMLPEAVHRLARSVDAVPDEGWSGPSLLPGWSRAHVLAHLTCNAEGLAGVLSGAATGERVSLYPSQQRRDADIDEGASSTPSELRERFMAATTRFARAVAAMPDVAWDLDVERVPGGRTFSVSDIPGMRLSEVEIHHVDLAIGLTHTDWTPGFAALVLEAVTSRPGSPRGMVAAPDDLDRTWTFGGETGSGPTVSGTAADLAWWLTGRGRGEGLTSNDGVLPEIGAW